jgi:hypothetical protein
VYAIGLGLAAVAVAAFAVVYAAFVEAKPALIAAKVALAAALLGLAGYAAKQSAEHRGREVRARRFVGDPGPERGASALTGGDISLVGQLLDAVSKFGKYQLSCCDLRSVGPTARQCGLDLGPGRLAPLLVDQEGEADANDAWRTEHGRPPRENEIIASALALRKFATLVRHAAGESTG